MKRLTHLKSIFFAFLFVFLVSGINSYAQDKPAALRAEELTNSMKCELDLTKSQIPDVRAINLDAAHKMDAAKLETNGDWKMYNKRGKEINKERNIALRDVLTPDQFVLYEKISKGNKMALKKTENCRLESVDNGLSKK